MPVTIGAAASSFADPIGLLSDCHRRIERFLQALITLTAETQGGALDADHRHALDVSLNYFRHAAPKHTEDEEQDLFPTLRESTRPDLQRILAHVDQLEDEHRAASALHREVEEIGERWLKKDHLSRKETIRLRELLTSLSNLYRSHIALEEKELFPIAQGELSDSEKMVIGRSMALRRGIPFLPEWARPKRPEQKSEA